MLVQIYIISVPKENKKHTIRKLYKGHTIHKTDTVEKCHSYGKVTELQGNDLFRTLIKYHSPAQNHPMTSLLLRERRDYYGFSVLISYHSPFSFINLHFSF